ncbi:MAG: TolC family protein [Paraprevotella sp.]|nr:TolC family protein [Paraprevotella sp.]
MKRIVIIIAVCACGLSSLQAQDVDDVLRSVAQHNKSIQARQKSDEAEKLGIEAENGLQDPTVEYSSFYSRGVSGQSGSELVVTQGFDFPTVYGARHRAGRERKAAVDHRAEALRRDILLEAKNLCLDLIRLNQESDLLAQRMQNADELLRLYEEKLKAGDATLIEVNKIKMERMSIQTEVLQNRAAHRTALQSLLALNGNLPLTFDTRKYSALPETRDFETLCSETLARDADLQAAEADIRAAARTLDVNRKSWWPKIEIGYRRNTSEDMKENGFIVGGSIPLFSNRRQVKIARAQSIGTQLETEALRLKTEAELRSGFNELQQLREALSVYDRTLMEQSLELLKESVKGGELSVTDYFVEADQIYRNFQSSMEVENQCQKTAAMLYKNRL